MIHLFYLIFVPVCIIIFLSVRKILTSHILWLLKTKLRRI